MVSNNGVLETGEEGRILELGVMMETEEVKDLLGVMSRVFENVLVTVMNLVLFWLSSILKVYGDLIVATSRYSSDDSSG